MPRDDWENWNLIETAPKDGTAVRAAHFPNRYFCDWVSVASFRPSREGVKPNWLEVDESRGQVFLKPTHWQPLN